MTGEWSMNVGGRTYGPFTLERMRSFASEGRLAPHSLVTREGAEDWHPAANEPDLADLFAPGTSENAVPAPVHSSAPDAAGSKPEAPEVTRAQFAVIIDPKARGPAGFDQAICALGPAYQLLPNMWIVSTEHTANAVRNRLVQELGKADSLFVVDATRGKAAWFNFGPEADARIRRVWHKAS
jgi:GYF domain 2